MQGSMAQDGGRAQAATGRPGLIHVSVARADDLFHAFDPSPLVGRDLDDDVEAYIVESARELGVRRFALRLDITEPAPDDAAPAALRQAILAYFAYRRDMQARRLRLLLREGRTALAMGLGFLGLCWGLGLLTMRLVPAPFGAFLNEGLLIIGWVANWRPVEIFLYDWRPMRRQRDIFDALAHMAIDIRCGTTK